MNKVFLIGRLTKDPDIRQTQGAEPITVARYSLAVDRRVKSQDTTADFPNCIAFGRSAEFAEKYLHKGMRIAVEGRLQTGSYTDQTGKKIYTTDVIVDNHEFVESKSANAQTDQQPAQMPSGAAPQVQPYSAQYSAPPQAQPYPYQFNGPVQQTAPQCANMPQYAQPYFRQGYANPNVVQQSQTMPLQQQFAPNITNSEYSASSVNGNTANVSKLANKTAQKLAEGFIATSVEDEGLPWN